MQGPAKFQTIKTEVMRKSEGQKKKKSGMPNPARINPNMNV